MTMTAATMSEVVGVPPPLPARADG